MRNIARAKKVKVPGAGGLAPPVAAPLPAAAAKTDKNELQKAADLAKKATASLGKFQGKLADSKLEEKASKRVKGVKRKFDPLVSTDGSEKARSLKVLDAMLNKAPKLELSNKVVGRQMQQNASDEAATARAGKKKAGGKKGKGGKLGLFQLYQDPLKFLFVDIVCCCCCRQHRRQLQGRRQ